ncbi:hypothetical protein U9M48_018294 [Paspalum notatum var. saurae]|uniref:Uncharacterized protein n=1 Tax=Paspalum notatum var. saurae TaxID=547442 RepID=A0AAQ3WQ07_PASNO
MPFPHGRLLLVGAPRPHSYPDPIRSSPAVSSTTRVPAPWRPAITVAPPGVFRPLRCARRGPESRRPAGEATGASDPRLSYPRRRSFDASGVRV